MELGQGFKVKIDDEECEQELLRLLAKRMENYPLICKKPRDVDDPIEYLISSLDGAFLTLFLGEEPHGLQIVPATQEDLRVFGLVNYPNQAPTKITTSL